MVESAAKRFEIDGTCTVDRASEVARLPRTVHQPSYRLHKARNCAVVTINGKNHYLGRYDSEESHQEYARLIAEWRRNGHQLIPASSANGADQVVRVKALTVESLAAVAKHLNAVKLAAWLHDVVYDTRAAAANQKPPLKWSETEIVLWKSPVPGRGHGSPTVVGEQVFLATADLDRETQSVLCYDRRTGKQLWQTEVRRGGLEKKGNAKTSLASATVVWNNNSPVYVPSMIVRDGHQ